MSQSNNCAIALLLEALERIATPKRPDGTYNLSREACEEIATDALIRWEDAQPDGYIHGSVA